jgi:hypothetical protein
VSRDLAEPSPPKREDRVLSSLRIGEVMVGFQECFLKRASEQREERREGGKGSASG